MDQEHTAAGEAGGGDRPPGTPVVLGVPGLQAIIDALRSQGFTVIGPTRRDGAIILAEIAAAGDLPAGWGDDQGAAHYRLHERADEAFFGFAATAQSWKSVLFPARELIWSGERDGGSFAVPPAQREVPAYALLGVRSCDLHAIGIHDRVLLGRRFTALDIYMGVMAHWQPGRAWFAAELPELFAVAEAVAERAGAAVPYVREWLSSQAAAGYLDYDPAAGTFPLAPGAGSFTHF